MPAPTNKFKQALKEGRTVIGCWLSLGEANAAAIVGKAGFDWLVVDSEHSPNDIRSIRDQLVALESSSSTPVVRVQIGETWVIKQVLDIGAQTILVPMVETAEQARQLVSACRYPPGGTRGVGYSAARASDFGRNADYGPTADEQICLLVQVESKSALENLDEILAVDGVDGVFIGPADLAASLGHLGDVFHEDVQEAVMGAIARIAASDKAAGILATRDDMIDAALEAGAQFVAVGLDVLLLVNAAAEKANHWTSRTR